MRREAFLSRISDANLAASLPEPPVVPAELPELPPADLVALFRARAQDVNAVVHGPVARHAVARSVSAIAAGHDAKRFVCWDDLPASGVITTLFSAGLERVEHEVPRDMRLDHNAGYFEVELGVTGALAGLAESGSLLLAHGPGRPRMASLVADIHIALLEVRHIHRGLAQWARENQEVVRETANLVAVTGPSRTGDIEQALNLGVHGPRHVHIVMIR